ncbi:unnamed protein product, partial [Scytosiphon promiscuus]
MWHDWGTDSLLRKTCTRVPCSEPFQPSISISLKVLGTEMVQPTAWAHCIIPTLKSNEMQCLAKKLKYHTCTIPEKDAFSRKIVVRDSVSFLETGDVRELGIGTHLIIQEKPEL